MPIHMAMHMPIHMSIHASIHMSIHMAYTHICAHVCPRTCLYARLCACPRTHLCTCVHTRVHEKKKKIWTWRRKLKESGTHAPNSTASPHVLRLHRHRRRHVHCAGTCAPVLKKKMTASARAFQRRIARAHTCVHADSKKKSVDVAAQAQGVGEAPGHISYGILVMAY